MSTSARTKLLVCLGAAIVGGAAAAAVGAGRSAPLIGWDILAVVFCAWVWSTVWRLDAKSTASHAQRENPGRDLADVVLLAAAVASLIAVGVVLFGAGHANGNLKYLQAGFALVSVSVSWTLVHTVFTLRYARLYYSGRAGGIDFNEADPPQSGPRHCLRGRYLTRDRTRSGSLLIRRQAAAMLVAPCRRWRLTARLRNVAMTCGP